MQGLPRYIFAIGVVIAALAAFLDKLLDLSASFNWYVQVVSIVLIVLGLGYFYFNRENEEHFQFMILGGIGILMLSFVFSPGGSVAGTLVASGKATAASSDIIPLFPVRIFFRYLAVFVGPIVLLSAFWKLFFGEEER